MIGGAGSVPEMSIFPTRILETGLKFHIWTKVEIGPGNRAHVNRPVNLISIYQLSNVHDSSLKTIAWFSEKKESYPIWREVFFTNLTLNLKFVVSWDEKGNHFVKILRK